MMGHKYKSKTFGIIQACIVFFTFFILATCDLQLVACYAESSFSSVEKMFLEGRYDKVIYESEKLIDLRARQRDEIYYLKALSELKLGRYSDSRRTFEELLSKYPRSKRALDARVGIGDAYFTENRYNEALKHYNDALNKFPNDKNISLVQYKINECRQKAGEPIEAMLSKPSRRPSRRTASITNFTPRRSSSSYKEIGQSAQGSSISIQVGCFKSRRNADGLSRKLRAAGYESFVEPPGAGDDLYRAKVGRLDSRADAESLASKLKKSGYKIKICGE